MTTGCSCGTPGCGGIAHERGGQCLRCQIEATPPGAARIVKQIFYTALYGRDIEGGSLRLICNDREAGS
jgi:hypothetical protein